jgi:hypothetical protein
VNISDVTVRRMTDIESRRSDPFVVTSSSQRLLDGTCRRHQISILVQREDVSQLPLNAATRSCHLTIQNGYQWQRTAHVHGGSESQLAEAGSADAHEAAAGSAGAARQTAGGRLSGQIGWKRGFARLMVGCDKLGNHTVGAVRAVMMSVWAYFGRSAAGLRAVVWA